jgi:D-alanyl-D-alanine carboxypeptidase/D-alanyl-D-alanine-endopeptidase (penicillin-binding protein 4)
LLVAPVCVRAGDLAETRSTLAGYAVHPSLRGAQVACVVYDLHEDEPEEILALLPDEPLIPASVMKMVISASAVDLWGADFEFDTSVWAARKPDSGGKLRGDLYVMGSASPEAGTTVYSYLARKLRSAGVQTVEGDVLGLRPVRAGDHDSGLRGAQGLHSALGKVGITSTGPAGSATRGEAGALLARHEGRSLRDYLRLMNKPSDNQKADQLLESLLTYFAPDQEAGFLLSAWEDHGLPVDGCQIEDGSGYSRANRLTARFVAELLVWLADEEKKGEALYQSLPVAGVDGTLEGRMPGLPEGARVVAKTGTLPQVSCLSGYVEVAGEKWLAFSILMNEFSCSRTQARHVQDQMGVVLARYAREQYDEEDAGARNE